MTRLARGATGRSRRLGLTSASLAAVAMTAIHVWPASPGDPASTAVVVEAPFRDTLLERGTVDSARTMLYGSTIAGAQAKILSIVAEGLAVEPGDVLVRFDPAPFEQLADREQASVAQADAERLRAREDLRQEQMRAEAETETAREQVGFAQTALASERDGKGPLAVAEATAAAHGADRELTRARASLEDMQALLKQGFVTRVEVDRADQAVRDAEDHARIAALRMETLTHFEQPAAIDKSRADVAAAAKALGASTESAESRLAQRRAASSLAESRLDEARARLSHAREMVDRTTVRSATAGLVVYRELFFGTDKRKPEPGDEVWPNQPIVAVPDQDHLVVESRVRELDLHKLSPNARVAVSVDAYPGLALPGTVSMVGALAQEDATRAGTRFFPVTVTLLQADPRLRTGMTARVEIEVTSIAHALVVPIQALVREQGVTRCYVVTRSGTVRRDVDVAARNDLVAAIRTGLRVGETVLIPDPARSEPANRERD